MSLAGSQLKSRLMEDPDEYFEPLTLGELRTGQKFIRFPLPGDNRGHGGFRKAAYLFVKTGERTAINLQSGRLSNSLTSMLVILVE